MAQPLGRGLRTARHRGLTSPDQVRPPTALAATPNPDPGPGTCGQAAEPSAAGKARPKTARGGKSPQPPHSELNRWIEGKGEMRPDAGSDGEAVSALAGFDKKTWVPQLGLAPETRNVCPA